MGGREGWFAGAELACDAELKLNLNIREGQ